jgi:thiol-disulfide isomerase/thioredoxin
MSCVLPWSASAQTLSIGDNAPAMDVSKWVKGEKIDKLDKDQTYVVEFWATWCGPCKISIPHITELQNKYKDKGVKFIGVSVWEQDQKAVEPFVKQMGDKMGYSVALDQLAKEDDPQSGKMAKNWMTASESQGIPTAFLVKSGKIAWIGHPMKLDKPLEKVVEPGFELARFISEEREQQVKEKAKEKEQEKKLEALGEKLQKLGQNASKKQILAVFNEAIAESPDLEEMLAPNKYILMLGEGDKGASAYGMKLVEGAFKDNSEALNQIAWINLDPDGDIPEDKRDHKLALKAAQKANDLAKGENGAILDTLGLAYFKTGDVVKALEVQEKAVKLTPDGDGAAEMKARLNQYKKAVADKKP